MRKLILLLLVCPLWATNAVYIAQSAAGGNTGADCADAKVYTYFNSSGNWSATPTGIQIGPDTTVHLCSTITGTNANAGTALQFQGSGTSGHPVTILFESGASMQTPYWASQGAIDINGQSHVVINGGSTCGKVTGAFNSTTTCNGLIENTLAGSTGATCPGGSCTQHLSGSTSSTMIGNSAGGTPTDVTIENIALGPAFVALASDTTDQGMATSLVGMGLGVLPSNWIIHHTVMKQAGKLVVYSLGSPGSQTTITDFELYNSDLSDHCWAFGIGGNSTNLNITKVLYHDNEDYNWDSWAPKNVTGNVCHGNGTMFFNGDGSTVHSTFGFIGDSTSLIYNNYEHGSLTGNTSSGTSPSGYLSCQDNCINVSVFNNLIVDTTTGPSDGGGGIYFNGAGGGGQQVYNNTIVRPCCSMTVWSAVTGNGILKNNILKCTNTNCASIEIRTSSECVVTSNNNDGFNNSISSGWTVYNTANSGTFRSLAQWKADCSQESNTVTTDPNLTVTYRLNSGSPAISLGVNLTSLGITALNSDAVSVARPGGSAAWDAGAFQFAAPAQPAPNGSLFAQGQILLQGQTQ